MNPTVVPILMIGLFVAIVIIGLVVWTVVRQLRQAAENIRQLATTLGLQFEDGPQAGARASGQLRGKRVELFSFSTGSGKSQTHWSAVSATVPGAGGLTFHLQRQGFGTKFLELFGAREIQTGDAEFDAAWFIQTNQPEYFRAALLPELRAKINALVRELGTQARGMEFRLEQNAVRYAEIGSFASGDSCKRCQRAAEIVGDLADLAEVFTGQTR